MLASTDKQTLVITMKHENESNIYWGNDLDDKGRNSQNKSLAMVLILWYFNNQTWLPRRCWPSGGC